MSSGISIFEIAILPIYLGLIYFFAFAIKSRRIKEDKSYEYFTKGLIAKIIGGIAVCLVYTYYYKGGDTINFFKGCKAMNNLIYYNFNTFIEILGGDLSWTNYSSFTADTGYPPTYMYKDPHTFTVIRYTSPLMLICFNSFLITTVILSSISYLGIWRFYTMMTRIYPDLRRQLAIAILFMPSVVFWGSGLLKDTYTFSSACWFTYCFYKIFIVREKVFINVIVILILSIIILNIKPYILIALLPGVLTWYIYTHLVKIKSKFLRFVLGPGMIVMGLFVSLIFISSLGDSFGKYSVDNITEVAKVTQQDLSRSEQYGKGMYEIPEIDGSIGSFLKAAPIGITAAWFRPFIFEASSVVMLVSAIENLIVLYLFIMLFVKIKTSQIFKIILSQPVVMFSLIFALIFGFAVGITTPNFGAMVRYKIPLVPFLMSAFFIIRYYYKVGLKTTL